MTTEDGSLERYEAARDLVRNAPPATISPTIVGVEVTFGTEPGTFCLAVRDSVHSVFPPAYHPELVRLLTENGLDGVHSNYESASPQPRVPYRQSSPS